MSLIINKGQSNTVVVTLKEKTTLITVFYLFEFKNTASGEKKYCVVSELSSELERYNKFLITEKTSPTSINGEIELAIGDYVYKIYEQDDETNLNPTGLTIVETGFASCVDLTTNLNKEYEFGILSNKVYNG